ncbi:hypothetical protein [Nostoc sp.]|uniref:hypothetical protein n=1 Tax=Nostoc sp. TaxID=1180 RepID=UPI002FFBD02B
MPEENCVSSFWRSHNFRLEPWGNDYEPPIQISQELSLTESDVNPTVEAETGIVLSLLNRDRYLIVSFLSTGVVG